MQRLLLAFSLLLVTLGSQAAVLTYGDKDIVGFGAYATDPTTGATLEGLAPGVSTIGILGLGGVNHGFPFDPEADDYAGTDQIYVGSNQTGFSDGYSRYAGRIVGPQVITLDYSSLVSSGEKIDTLTLGIGFDDFQFPAFGNPYSASVNGNADAALSALANSFIQTGPETSFGSIGIDPGILAANHVLTLSIDQGGAGGDGWAIDFLTVGVTTSPIPLPPAAILLASALGLLVRRRA